MPNLRHIDKTGTARFVTFTCYQRYPYLTDDAARQCVLDALNWLRAENNVKILGYVIMPEHEHLVLHPPEDAALGLLLGRMKARAARSILSRLRDPKIEGRILLRSNGNAGVWQRRCFDHNC
ncbi:MAG: hypothetical protein GY867_02145, partial [bacterium]|nr:hypothetical protein [bacterium]